IKEYVAKLIKVWPVGLLSLLLCGIIAVSYLIYATPQYHINSKILIQDDKKSGGQAGAAMMDLTSLLGGKSTVDNEVEVLNTRYLMDRLVRDKQLNIVWYEESGLKRLELDKDPFELRVVSLSDSIIATYFDFYAINSESFRLNYEDPVMEKDRELTFRFNEPFDIPNFGRFVIERKSTTDIENHFVLTISSIDSRVESLRKVLSISTTNKLASTISIQFDYPLP